ncbi:lytic polysaccharide monooxygenase [Macroventuria anomochaeta]|uniref:Lytic polysaccharide monooxygenase n=1 Tax=Macroventuria anomochaeta TaxID=301207 RepID=A0ACB6S045_9PLEO|nr:lytic polysaccharide monooxygenase [Macroventuria anomochaeta]KAF2626774.1 lytic polysaccharide monooxygenase [Macroventuria anomochaeta]
MKTQSMLIAALASAPAALAHTAFTDFYVDSVPQGDGVAMRMSTNVEHSTAPISSLGSDDMACNVGGSKGVSRVQSVSDGATLSFEIRAWPADASKERLDRGHKGPCAVYLKKVSSAIEDTAAGDGWFKIFEHGYDSSTDRWCSDEVIDNNGLLNVKLPANLERGNYLARPELLALHAANDNDPQFYTGCAQIFLESDGNLVPESTVSIPGYVDYGEPSTSFDIYNKDASTYEMPGPKIAKLTANSAANDASGQTTQTEGQKPAGCLVENANWCGTEVSDYTTEKGCWASAEECWQQAETCFDEAPITGSAGCTLWQTKCQGINDQCTAGNFQGPPNKGKVLAQEKKSIDIGTVLSGGIDSSDVDTTPKSTKKTSAAPTKATSTVSVKEEPKATSTEAAYPTTTDYSSPPIKEVDDSEAEPSEAETPKATSTVHVAPSEAAPAPTAAPELPESSEGGSSCKDGYVCVTVTDIQVVTQYITVTADYNEYRKRDSAHVVRRRHARR